MERNGLLTRFQRIEKHGVGTGRPAVGAQGIRGAKERGAAFRIEMRRRFVGQQDRGDTGHAIHEPRVGQHQADQQRLLLAGRTQFRRHGLLAVGHAEIDAVRTRYRATGTAVDAWQVTGESADGTLGFGLFLTSLDSSLYSNMDYAVNPPSWSDIDYASFAIREVDSGGNLIYMAFGTVDNINGAAPVPLPGAVWLLGSGLVGLLGIAARRRVA